MVKINSVTPRRARVRIFGEEKFKRLDFCLWDESMWSYIKNKKFYCNIELANFKLTKYIKREINLFLFISHDL